ncbi:MAG TPA: selenocysteine-specific translation elongation factor [Acidimicrobiia bacterium]|nr:selenocysteine-specific translation elongation factor [Acidimicrobiia bacterium]
MRVVATAGHVDHGKSSLVLALTGTDPDRWPEEKTRGLTIDLGFAFTTLPSGQQLGFVDVPGHVRFLKNMLAGVGAVEAAVLVVAATEGWMPQSEEHLRILDLLGISHGLAVITKADLVDDDLLELARLEVEERLAGTSSFMPTEVLSVDSRSGRGLDELRVALDTMLASAPLAADRGRPRLWVDRVFAAKGAGTVVTGTMAGGTLPLDAEVLIVPGRKRARVRHIESHHEELAEAGPGRRVALNLAGIDHTELARGSALVLPDQWVVTSVVDARLTALPDVDLRQGAYKAYIGSGERDVRLRLIRPLPEQSAGGATGAGGPPGDSAPGGEGCPDALFGRLRLDVPLALQPGDRIVLRDSGSQMTVGGAEVLDVSPVGRARLAADRLPLPVGPRILAGRPWLRPGEIGPLAGAGPGEAKHLAEDLVRSGAARPAGEHLVAADTLTGLRRRAVELVGDYHRKQPLEPGLDLPALAASLGLDPARVRAGLEGTEGLVVEHGRVRLSTHRGRVAGEPEAQKLLAALDAVPFSPPAPAEVGGAPEIVRGLIREGLLIDLDGTIFTTAAIEKARQVVRDAFGSQESLTVSQARDLLGSSRKYVLAILAHFDAEGVTRRRGDERFPGPRLGS